MSKSTKDLLSDLNVIPSKDFGQSFLVDPSKVSDILDFASISEDCNLLEIGPGLGALTRELYSVNKNLSVIEIEKNFSNFLKQEFPKLNVVNEDVRTVEFDQFGDNLIVFGNLPYVFSTDILFKLISEKHLIKRAIVMFQKEYAERLFAKPNSKKYASLTLQVGVHANVIPGPIITGDRFYPEVKVESQVVEIRFRDSSLCPDSAMFYFQRLVSASFFRRRKKILNSIKLSKAFNELELSKLKECDVFEPNTRAEAVSIDDYVEIAKSMSFKD